MPVTCLNATGLAAVGSHWARVNLTSNVRVGHMTVIRSQSFLKIFNIAVVLSKVVKTCSFA